jgi:hypothetical protein
MIDDQVVVNDTWLRGGNPAPSGTGGMTNGEMHDLCSCQTNSKAQFVNDVYESR